MKHTTKTYCVYCKADDTFIGIEFFNVQFEKGFAYGCSNCRNYAINKLPEFSK